MRASSRFNRTRRTARRSMNERMDLVEVVFALQSQEDENLFVAAEEAEDVAEADDDETGVPFTDSMDENVVMLFPSHEEAKQYAEENGLIDKIKIVAVSVHPDEEEEGEATEEVAECYTRMGEALRLRRNRARRLGESRNTRIARAGFPRSRRLGESRATRRPSQRPRFGRR